MFLTATFVSALLFGSVVRSQSSTTASAPGATHTVSVGGSDGLNFNPNQIKNVPVGDIIEFRFYPQNHSVARAAFGPTPCIPYEYTGDGRVGFWSGFRPTELITNNPPIFRLPINDTEPVFFYCSAPDACYEGMIGVINPNATFTFAQQLNYTQNATMEFSPLESFPVEAIPTRTTTATGAPTSASTSSASSATTTAAVATTPTSSKSSSLGTGPIVGIAIGGFAVVVLAAALIYMCGRQKTVTEILNRQSMAPSNHNSYMPATAGMSEAQYPNVAKTPAMSDGRFSGYGPGGGTMTETESYRSMSPPIDERTGFMGMQQQMHLQNQGSGIVSPGSPGYPSPTYYEAQEMDNAHESTGFRPYNPQPQPSPTDQGPHEMAVPSRNPSAATGNATRPFSYADSEAGFTSAPRGDVKS